MSAGKPGRFEGRTFTAPSGRLRWFTDAVVRRTDVSRETRVLDLGCGTGLESLALAEALPRATITGVDISGENVAAAEALRRGHPAASRLSFARADYLEFTGGPFDLVVSDSTLHNVAATDDELFRKLARDTAPNAVLVVTWPYDCLFNRLLWLLRRVLKGIRCPLSDALVLGIAGVLHPEMGKPLLRQRVEYMYLLPRRSYDGKLRAALRDRYGFDMVEEENAPHASIAQPKHRLCVFRRRSG